MEVGMRIKKRVEVAGGCGVEGRKAPGWDGLALGVGWGGREGGGGGVGWGVGWGGVGWGGTCNHPHLAGCLAG